MSFDYDPNEQAQISGADFAEMCGEMKQLQQRNKELEAEIKRLREQEQKKAEVPGCEANTTKVSVPIDCGQCVNFVWRSHSCVSIYTCINGSQYKPSNFIQIFRKE